MPRQKKEDRDRLRRRGGGARCADGWEHFLARYDGNSHETASGLVYRRVN